jgi:hypothetical protein
VIIHDFNLRRSFLGPHKANPELVVDPDAVLAGAIARQGFEPVAGRRQIWIIGSICTLYVLRQAYRRSMAAY